MSFNFTGTINIFIFFKRFIFFAHSLFKVNYFGLIVKPADLKAVLCCNPGGKAGHSFKDNKFDETKIIL
ncbi:MAG: hypothetical protein CVU55_06840 [Deltaproteobacteria bacterium HGW-Deltaproteobacteria-13]|jgi:hypothetical protein|nr:MAG: hypothetical protein CVU55_06840 [Deltaproteobacteria bacterium HGW-Deltaproteobacteria-13]